jgi:hypothetical protein
MAGLLVGLLNILLWVLIAAIVVYVIIFVAGALGFPLPPVIQKLLWAVVAIIALIMLIELLLGGGPPILWRRAVTVLPWITAYA